MMPRIFVVKAGSDVKRAMICCAFVAMVKLQS
jgi:hypothetical protein